MTNYSLGSCLKSCAWARVPDTRGCFSPHRHKPFGQDRVKHFIAHRLGDDTSRATQPMKNLELLVKSGLEVRTLFEHQCCIPLYSDVIFAQNEPTQATAIWSACYTASEVRN